MTPDETPQSPLFNSYEHVSVPAVRIAQFNRLEAEETSRKQGELERAAIARAAERFGVVRRPRAQSITLDEALYEDLKGVDALQPPPEQVDCINASFLAHNATVVARREQRKRASGVFGFGGIIY